MQIDDERLYRLSPFPALIAHLRSFLTADHPVSPRLNVPLDNAGAAMLVMPAVGGDVAGVKVITVVPGNPRLGRPTIQGRYLLIDRASGTVIAELPGAALTHVRTAAVSALAADLLAPAHAARLLMIGTGALAEHLVRAHCAVRRYETLMLWGRDHAKATQLAQLIDDIGIAIEIVPVDGLRTAIESADLVSSATSSEAPLIPAEAVRQAKHIDLVGSFSPIMREIEAAAFVDATLVVDALEAFEKSGDLIAPAAQGLLTAPGMTLIAAPA